MVKSVLEHDALFSSGDDEKIWLKYCSFLDLSLAEFMVIQKTMLGEQLRLLNDCTLTRKLTSNHGFSNLDEFRRNVPLTTYKDYEPYLRQKMEDMLPAAPLIWAHTSGKTGYFKWVPYTREQIGRLADDTLSAFILSAASMKGEVRIREGERVMLNLPPIPYMTGIMAAAVAQRLNFQAIPPFNETETLDFYERVQKGFVMALDSGVDFAASIAVVLAKIGESFASVGRRSDTMNLHLSPLAYLRLLGVFTRAKFAGRPPLPKDIWKVKGLVCGGTDTSIYRDQIAYYWGVQPLDAYAATETGYIALQAWDKTTMTFIPYTNLYEFIPEEERLKWQREPQYQPSTVLMNEVKQGQTYELVITNFHGGPFIRYRMGDLITITSLHNSRTGINLPQMVFRSRADDIVDIAGFARLDEKTLWQAIQNTGIPYEDWSARKEYQGEKLILHVYIELTRSSTGALEFARLIDQQLIALDKDYRDLKKMTGMEPVVVTLLVPGTFERYMKSKQSAGIDLAHFKPPHTNAADDVISSLLSYTESPV